jgi:hypothetical protein
LLWLTTFNSPNAIQSYLPMVGSAAQPQTPKGGKRPPCR